MDQACRGVCREPVLFTNGRYAPLQLLLKAVPNIPPSIVNISPFCVALRSSAILRGGIEPPSVSRAFRLTRTAYATAGTSSRRAMSAIAPRLAMKGLRDKFGSPSRGGGTLPIRLPRPRPFSSAYG